MIKWKDKKQRYSNGQLGYMNQVPAFDIDYDSGSPPEGRHWELRTRLPGFTSSRQHFDTMESAKSAAGVLLIRWLKLAGFKEVKKCSK